jgi:hypothetical protein
MSDGGVYAHRMTKAARADPSPTVGVRFDVNDNIVRPSGITGNSRDLRHVVQSQIVTHTPLGKGFFALFKAFG